MRAKSAAAVVMDRARASVDGFRRVDDLSAEDVAHALKAEAHAENRDVRFQEDPAADAEVAFVFGMAGAGRKNDPVRCKFEELIPGQLVVADDDRRQHP